MSKSKLLDLLSTFSTKDWRDFSRSTKKQEAEGSVILTILTVVQNQPLNQFNSNTDIVRYIKSTVAIKHTEKSLSNSLLRLTKKVENYLILDQLASDRLYREAILATALAERGTKGEFHPANSTETLSDPYNLWDSYHKLKVLFHAYYGGYYKNYQASKVGLQNLTIKLNQLNAEISSFLVLEMINRSKILSEDWSAYKSKLSMVHELKSPVIELFNKTREFMASENEDSLNFLVTYLDNYEGPKSTVQEVIVAYLISHFNRKIKQGQEEHVDELLHLYTIGVEKGLYITKGIMSVRRYLNIIHTACVLDKAEWGQNFIKYYSGLLDKKNASEAMLIASAEISFTMGNFKNTSIQLHKHRFKNFDLELRARLLKLQCNYEVEKDHCDYIVSEIESLYYFVKRNEAHISQITQDGIFTLLKYVKQLIRYESSKVTCETLEKEKFIFSKKWLREKIREKEGLT